MSDNYQLLDCGAGYKLEQVGPYRIKRPAPIAFWQPRLPEKEWQLADFIFSREKGAHWLKNKAVKPWQVQLENIRMQVVLTAFGHLGFFPEHQFLWKKLLEMLEPKMPILNLFAYSGGASLVAAKKQAQVCHVDASKPMVEMAKANAALNQITNIRWIVDDVFKFLKREKRRNAVYAGIILDPPSFGRGTQEQVFKIENDIIELLDACFALKPSFVIFSCHTPGFTGSVLKQLLNTEDAGELLLKAHSGLVLPSGHYAIWRK